MASLDVTVARAGKTGFTNACIDEYLGMYPADSDGTVHIGMMSLEVIAKSKNPPARLRNL